ncbi:cellulase family glycosylhydrolase [Candidatus Curtissbacteria bacterium]|nr:cellulase family glycosylhydrolase [Candidatus Curtissbacteria bacterium]
MLVRFLFILLLLFAAYVAHAFSNPFPTSKSGSQIKPSYGFTYIFDDAVWYGLDTRASLIKLLDEFDFQWVRLPFFWDQMTDENGNLKLDDLIFAISEAQKRDVKVVIALGAKTPSYPEFHWPEKIASRVKFGETIGANHPIATDILEIDRKVVEQLAQFDNISHWQIENEPFLANINNIKIDKSLIAAEVRAVRTADSKRRPIILSHVGPATIDGRWRLLLDLLQPGDVLAVNAYFKTQGVYLLSFSLSGNRIDIRWPRWFTFPSQSWLFLSPNYKSIKEEVESKNIDFWVLEMQAEPYIRSLEDAKRSEFPFTAEDLAKADLLLRTRGVETIGFWGVHFWQYRESIGDKSWIRAVKEIVNR